MVRRSDTDDLLFGDRTRQDLVYKLPALGSASPMRKRYCALSHWLRNKPIMHLHWSVMMLKAL